MRFPTFKMSQDPALAAFNAIDTNKNGKIDRNELQQALSLMGMSLTNEQIGNIIRLIDKNFDQELDFDEFKLFIRIC